MLFRDPSSAGTLLPGRGLYHAATACWHLAGSAVDRSKEKMKNALLVDDEPEICLLLGNMLRRAGVQCVLAHSVEEGRQALAKVQFDMVFLDVNLPDGLGYELVPDIKSSNPEARSIAISAMDNEGLNALDAGADVFIAKPFDRAIILSSIRDLGFQV